MGGFETTAHTLSFTLFCIALYSEVQEEIQNELGKFGLLHVANTSVPTKKLGYNDLQQLTYLDSVLKESMRIFPVVAGFPRYCNSRAISSGMKIFLICQINCVHDEANVYEKCALSHEGIL